MIEYVVGDATDPCTQEGTRIIAHICNDQGGWGSGFVVALSKKWKGPEAAYRSFCQENFNLSKPVLGHIQMVEVGSGLKVCNMIAQNGFVGPNKPRAVSYDALDECLGFLDKSCIFEELPVTIHMPRIGCGLGGGEWNVVEQIVSNRLKKHDIYVYDLP